MYGTERQTTYGNIIGHMGFLYSIRKSIKKQVEYLTQIAFNSNKVKANEPQLHVYNHIAYPF